MVSSITATAIVNALQFLYYLRLLLTLRFYVCHGLYLLYITLYIQVQFLYEIGIKKIVCYKERN